MKTTTFAVLAIAASALLCSPFSLAEAKDQKPTWNDIYSKCRTTAAQSGLFNQQSADKICEYKADKDTSENAERAKPRQRLKLNRTRNTRTARPRIRIRRGRY